MLRFMYFLDPPCHKEFNKENHNDYVSGDVESGSETEMKRSSDVTNVTLVSRDPVTMS